MTIPASSKVKEDSILAFLAKLQMWLNDNWKWMLIMVLVAVGFALVKEKLNNDKIEGQQSLWNEAAKANTIDQRAKFIKGNPDAEATKLLSLQLTRQYLDEGKYQAALDMVSSFITKNPNHPFFSIALTLKAYAQEELNQKEEALKTYKEVEAQGGMMAFISKQSSERLEGKTAQ